MKNNYWLIFTAMLSTTLLAEPITNTPPTPAASPGATNALAATNGPAAAKTNVPTAKALKKKSATKKSEKKSEKKSAAKKKDPAAELKTVPLVAGKALVIASNVNVRGQAKLNSEVVTRLTKGQEVAVLEEVTLKKSAPDEPSAWAKIILPAKVHVWVNSSFIDTTNKTVIPKKLKLRAGPGEEYSVLGILQRGATVTEVGTKGAWTEIEAPAEACGFVAAQYLRQEPPGTAPTTPPEPPPIPATVADTTPVAAPPSEPLAVNKPPPAVTNAIASTEPVPPPPPPPVDEPPQKRIVQREGLVRGTVSIQAPTKFALISPDNGKTIDYLYTTSTDLDLSRYKGLRIIVTGEEGLDDRWGNTPVITIQKIQVLE